MDGERVPPPPATGAPAAGAKPPAKPRATPAVSAAKWKAAIPEGADLTDPLALNMVAHRALGIAMTQVLQAVGIKLADRVKMLCEISGRMAPLTPMSRLYEAEQMIRGEGDAMKGPAGGPKLTPAREDAPQTSTVAAASGGGTPRRGRPRKRPMG